MLQVLAFIGLHQKSNFGKTESFGNVLFLFTDVQIHVMCI